MKKENNPAEEQVCITDENDNVVGQAPRKEMRAKNLWHRGTGIIIFNSKGEILVHKRTMIKDIYPGHYDFFFGGIVASDESYDLSAKRELEEEAGIKETPIKFLFNYKYDTDKSRYHVNIYKTNSDGPFKFQEEEVESTEFVSIEKAKEMIKTETFIPDAIYAFKRYLGECHTQDDLIDVVDENNNVIDTVPKHEIREKVLTHRGVDILLMNSKGEIFVHQRALVKKTYPGYWAIFLGGYVDHGEDYETAALRELEEESGIKADKLDFVTDFRYKTDKDDWFGKLYKFISDNPVRLQEEELEQGIFITLEELDQFLETNKIKPSHKFIYGKFRELIR